jgi:hypothetical protein
MQPLTPREGLQIVVAKVPEDGNVSLIEINNEQRIVFDIPEKDTADYGKGYLPTGFKYSILLDTKTATEEQWREVVKELSVGNRWENYCGNYPIWRFTATQSGHSLLRAHNLEGRHIFLKQEKL